uniref:Retrotransposon gag domain-containing protein n=1 Tax=Brassica oleracea var. oleracea TaxID=109376 RepID=A0A0D3BFG3_BRAOL
MKAHDSLRNPAVWCDFHRDHGHKTEDCIALRIEVNELLQKGHLREFLSEKAKAHLSKETSGKPKGDAPSSPPRQDRVIHVISGGSEISGISHAAAKKSTRNAKYGLETAQPKRLLLGTDEISFTAKEQERILAPHHDALVVSLTVANCLVKRILIDNGSSSNIIFLTAYQDLGLEENTLTRKVTPLIGFSGEVKQTAVEITLPVYAEGINLSTKFLVVDCHSAYTNASPKPWRPPENPRRPLRLVSPEILQDDAYPQDLVPAGPSSSTSTTSERVLLKKGANKHKAATPQQAEDLQTRSIQWMNATTHFMQALRTLVNGTPWSPSFNNMETHPGWGRRTNPSATLRLRKTWSHAAEGEILQQEHSHQKQAKPHGSRSNKREFTHCTSTATAGSNLYPVSPDVENSKAECSTGNSVVTSFRAVEYKIPPGTERSHTQGGRVRSLKIQIKCSRVIKNFRFPVQLPGLEQISSRPGEGSEPKGFITRPQGPRTTSPYSRSKGLEPKGSLKDLRVQNLRVPSMTSGSRDHQFDSRPQGPEPKGSSKEGSSRSQII